MYRFLVVGFIHFVVGSVFGQSIFGDCIPVGFFFTTAGDLFNVTRVCELFLEDILYRVLFSRAHIIRGARTLASA